MTTKKRAFSTRNTGNNAAAQRRSAEIRRCPACDRKAALVYGEREWLDDVTLLVPQACRFCGKDSSHTITVKKAPAPCPNRCYLDGRCSCDKGST